MFIFAEQQAVFAEACLRKTVTSQAGLLFVFMCERRAAHRHRVLKGGAIELSDGGTISCAVKNLLAAGRL